MIHLVLQQPLAADWEDASYDKKVYCTFEMDKRSTTFNDEASAFKTIGLRSLLKVQNPFQLGRFILKKELIERSEAVNLAKYYHPVHSADVENALSYNCDVRRYQRSYSGINAESDANPIFYKTPDLAWAAVNKVCENVTIIICHVLFTATQEYKMVPIDDTYHVPIFVAKV